MKQLIVKNYKFENRNGNKKFIYDGEGFPEHIKEIIDSEGCQLTAGEDDESKHDLVLNSRDFEFRVKSFFKKYKNLDAQTKEDVYFVAKPEINTQQIFILSFMGKEFVNITTLPKIYVVDVK